jgi:N-acetylneuraminic acid mutarotase
VELVTRRALAVTTAVVTAALVLVACGGSGGSDGARSATTSAPVTSTSSSTAVTSTTGVGARSVNVTRATWTLPAPVAREVVVTDGSELTVAGGLDATKFSTADVVTVDPRTGAVRASAKLAEAVHDSAGARVGGRLVVFGGGGPSESGTADVQASATSGTATTIGKLPGPRSDHVAATVGTTTYVLGGFDGAAIVPGVVSTTDGTAFTTIGSLPVPVRYPAVAVVGRSVYLFGGVANSAAAIDTDAVQRLDTATGHLDRVATLPSSLSHASAVVLGGQVYLLGGYVHNSQLSDQVLRFDPESGAATVVGRLPAPLSDAAAVVIGSTGYLVGGQGADRNPVTQVLEITVG